MSDEMDFVQEREQNDREIAIKFNKRPELPATGAAWLRSTNQCLTTWEKRRNMAIRKA